MAVGHVNSGDAEKQRGAATPAPVPAFKMGAKMADADSSVSDTQKSPRTLREKIAYIRNNITVEPTLACYIMPSVLAMLATQNLNLEKACRVNLAYPNEVCDALSARDTANYTKEESEVQQLVASMAGWKTFLQSSVPAFMILFVGSWTDRRGRRKPCILLPIFGEFLTCVGLIICTYFFYELPMEVAGLTEAIFPAVTGGWFTMFMAVYSYVGEVTTVENRTLRIGIVNVFCSLGVPIGMALSGVLYKRIGFYGVFSLSACMYLISISYAIVFIKESPRKDEIEEAKAAAAAADGAEKPEKLDAEKAGSIVRCFDGIRDFFDVKHIKETFRVAFREGPRNRRKRVILLMVVLMVVIGPMHGEFTVLYLFMRYRFNWNEVDYSIFSTYSMVTNLIGTALSVGLFSHVLKIDDAMIGIMSCMSKILAGFVYAFATTDWMVYLAPLVDFINSTSYIAMRSIASKLVPADELGKVNSLFGVCEALMPLVYGPMYSYVYSATIRTAPGSFFILGGVLTSPAVVIFGWMYTVHRKERRDLKAEEKTEEEKETAEAAVTEGDGEGKESSDSCHVNRSFQNDSTDVDESRDGEAGHGTTADIFLRASWREKTHNNNNRQNGGTRANHVTSASESTNNED